MNRNLISADPEGQVESRPLVTDLRVWFEAQIASLPARGPSAEAIRYALNHWAGLERFFEDGRIELDTNASSAPCAQLL
jgi:transposase